MSRAGFSWPGQVDVDDSDAARDARFATGNYITTYAATKPTEDIAEVFAAWVLEESGPTDGVVAQKLNFFDDFPELVKLKDAIRAASSLALSWRLPRPP